MVVVFSRIGNFEAFVPFGRNTTLNSLINEQTGINKQAVIFFLFFFENLVIAQAGSNTKLGLSLFALLSN